VEGDLLTALHSFNVHHYPLLDKHLETNKTNMLALITTTALTLASPVTLKNPPPLLPTSQHLPHQYFTSVWSPDNSSLYLASPFSIDRFILVENRLEEGVHVQSSEEDEITAVSVSASGNLVLGIGRKVVVVEFATGTRNMLKTFESHATAINALAVSNDSTLIASASSKGVHIHDLVVPAKHTSLRLPTNASKSVNTLMFHSHVRTRLLLGSGCNILVYDVAKPSAPLKSINIGQDIVDIACSPFSKTLVAVASTGSVNLVDLDKEKGYVKYKHMILYNMTTLCTILAHRLFKTVLCPESITSITFSPEGAAIYIGTQDGMMILNLRELDKEMKRVLITGAEQGIVCLAVQVRIPSDIAPCTWYLTSRTEKTEERDSLWVDRQIECFKSISNIFSCACSRQSSFKRALSPPTCTEGERCITGKLQHFWYT
jgi:protein NEDD1